MSSTSSSADNAELFLVPSQLLDDEWATALPFIERALPRALGRINASDVYNGVRDQTMQLWFVADLEKAEVQAVGVSEVLSFPRKKVLSVFLYSGRRRGVMRLWPHLERWARLMGCEDIQLTGSNAWKRLFQRVGVPFEIGFTALTRRVV